MSDFNATVFKIASGDISVWVDGGVHLKLNAAGGDPVELGEEEAMELESYLFGWWKNSAAELPDLANSRQLTT